MGIHTNYIVLGLLKFLSDAKIIFEIVGITF